MNRYLFYVTLICLLLTNFLFAQSSSPLAYFPFNGNADDESGNGNHGSVVGATLTEDRFGNDSSAYSFDGIDNYIAYPTLWSSSPNALTMVAWFNKVPTQVEGKILYHGVNGEFQMSVIDTTAFAAVHLPSNWYFSYANISPSTWHFLVGVWEKGASLLLYLDGKMIDSVDVADEFLLDVGSGYVPSIGSYSQTGGAYFEGMIDDIRVYDRALTINEIDSLFNESTTSVEEIGSTIPNEYILNQNYPNPFNPSTKIEYSIPEASFVQLKIYDILGNEVATLVNKEQSTGTYRADFIADNFASGLYVAQLRAGNFTKTIKMTLLR